LPLVVEVWGRAVPVVSVGIPRALPVVALLGWKVEVARSLPVVLPVEAVFRVQQAHRVWVAPLVVTPSAATPVVLALAGGAVGVEETISAVVKVAAVVVRRTSSRAVA